MLENSVVQISTGKLIGITLLPSSVLLVSGIIIWRYWRKQQAHLQTETDELNDKVGQIIQQMADTQAEEAGIQATAESSAPQQKSTLKTDEDMAGVGLFEFIIQDNIQLRQETS